MCDDTLSKNDTYQAILPLKSKQNIYKTDYRVTKPGHTDVNCLHTYVNQFYVVCMGKSSEACWENFKADMNIQGLL